MLKTYSGIENISGFSLVAEIANIYIKTMFALKGWTSMTGIVSLSS